MENPELQQSAEVRPAETLDTTVSALRKTIGPPPEAVPDTMTQAENDERRREILRGGFDDAGELYEFGVLRLELQRLQMQKEMSEGKTVDRANLIVISQGEAYHEYLPILLKALEQSMLDYKAALKTIPKEIEDVKEKENIARGEVQAQVMLDFLNDALRERVEFGNALLLAQSLRYGQKFEGGALTEKERADYQKRLDAALQSKTLRRDSLDALQKSDETLALEHANRLNQRILDVLSGKTMAVEKAEVAFFPQTLELELLTSAYERTLEKEKEVVNDPKAPNRESMLKKLKGYRKDFLERLLAKTDDLAKFQIRAEELTAIQRQFGRAIDPLAGPSNPQGVPEDVKAGIEKNMETRKNFHLDRIGAFLGTLEKEDGILSIGAGERLEDFNNKNLRPIVLKVVEVLAGLASLPAPEAYDMKNRIRNAVAGDLEDAMGLPKNPDGTPKAESEWTSEERAEVEKKAKSVLDAISEFRFVNGKNEKGETVYERDIGGNLIEKDHTKKLRSTIDAVRAMPPAKDFVGQKINALPTERITPENREDMIARNGGPAVYAKLLAQLLEDWGDADDQPPKGVMGESAEMMRKIDGVVGVHIDVAEAETQLARDVWQIVRYLIYALIALGVLQGVQWLNTLRKMAFGTKDKRELKKLRDQVQKLQSQIEEAQKTLSPDAAKRAEAEKLLNLDQATGEFKAVPPAPEGDATDIQKGAADVDSAAKSDQETDTKGKKGPKGGGKKG